MAEEHRCQSPPEGPRLCANNCGFFGSPTTLGLCSKCYRDLRLREELFQQQQQSNPPKIAALDEGEEKEKKTLVLPTTSLESSSRSEPSVAPTEQQTKRRCGACGRKVGLTGFRCRCGGTYCGAHRHPEGHACGYDYRGAGREAIARDNPVVKARKLENRI